MAVSRSIQSESTSEKPGQGSSISLSLRSNISWTLAGNLLYAGCQWGMLAAIAKLGSVEMVGQFALGLAITAPIIIFSNLQTRGVQATDAKRQYSFGDYLGLRLITTVLAMLLICGLVLLSGYRPETALIILLIGLAKSFESISDIFYGLLQQHERMDKIAISMIIRGGLALIALASLIFITNSLLWAMMGYVLAWTLALLFYDVRVGRQVLASQPVTKDASATTGPVFATLRPNWNVRTLLKLTWLALPLGFVMLLTSLNTNIPRYFVEHYAGERELGIFAALSYLIVLGNTVVNALGQAASPRLSKYFAAGAIKDFRSLLFRLCLLGGVIGVLGTLAALVAGPLIVTLLYRSEYAAYSNIFFWLMAGATFAYISSFMGYGLTAARYFRSQMPLYLACGITTALSCAILVPSFNLLGATLALVISATFQVLGSFAIIEYALRRKPKHSTNEKSF